MRVYRDRREAGEKLSLLLTIYKDKKECIVIGLPRGGVVVAAAVANLLHLPLDLIAPRKLQAPFNPELAIGAIAGDVVLLHKEMIEEIGVSPSYLKKEIQKQKTEAEHRLLLYRKGRKEIQWKNRVVLLIDDGIATGATMEASISFLKKQHVKKIVAAVPVAPLDTFIKMQKSVDALICPVTVRDFFSVSEFYEIFDQTSDAEVISLLERYSRF